MSIYKNYAISENEFIDIPLTTLRRLELRAANNVNRENHEEYDEIGDANAEFEVKIYFLNIIVKKCRIVGAA